MRDFFSRDNIILTFGNSLNGPVSATFRSHFIYLLKLKERSVSVWNTELTFKIPLCREENGKT